MAAVTQADIRKAELEKLRAEAICARQAGRKHMLEADKLQEDKDLRNACEYAHRIYTFDVPVNKMSAGSCISEIGLWVRQNPAQPIRIIFNSPGGSVFDGLALYDYIREIRAGGTRVDTFSLGMAASMGGILLQAGETRVMSPHAYMLIHEVSSGAVGNTSELEDELKFTKRLQDRLLDILAERSSLNKQQIARRWKKTDWWLSASEALELGFIDEIRG